MSSSQAFDPLPSLCLVLRFPQEGALASAVSSETSRLRASPGSRARGRMETSACFLRIPSTSVKCPYQPAQTDADVGRAHTAVVWARRGRHAHGRVLGGTTAWSFGLVTEIQADFLEEAMRLLSVKMRSSQRGWGWGEESENALWSARESCPAAS